MSLLRYEAARRPEIAAILDKIHTYTVAELAVIPVPLPWYRKALLMVHERVMEARVRGLTKAPLDLKLDDFIVTGHTPDPEGWLYEFVGDSSFHASILVETGSFVFLQDDGKVWFDTVLVKSSESLLRDCRKVSRTTKLGYKNAIRDRRLHDHRNAPVVMMPGADSSPGQSGSQPLSHLGVTIQR